MDLKRNKGITLIALVITIIVLLILAGVTINMVLGQDGIIARAQAAKKANKDAEEKEMIERVVTGESILRIANKETRTTTQIASKIEEELEKKLGENLKSVTANEETGKILITTTDKTYTVDANMKVKETELVVSKLKVGDYVTYIDKNGNELECIVLYDSTSEYGTQIISAEALSEVTIGVEDDLEKTIEEFNNAVTILNSKVAEYFNGTYATRVRSVGTHPANESYNYIPTGDQGIFKYRVNEIINVAVDGPSNSGISTIPDYLALNSIVDELGVKYAYNTEKPYWFAYRTAYSENYTDGDIWGTISEYRLHSSGWSDGLVGYDYAETYDSTLANTVFWDLDTNGVRPVFTLKNEVIITEGQGSSDSPYKLGV